MRSLLALLFLLLPFMARADEVKVSCAISLKEAITEVARAFEESTGAKVVLNFGASGQLAQQIEAGAECDLFISAANAQVESLSKAQLTDDASRFIVARNTLVLIVPADAKDPPSGFDALAEAGVKRIAIGEPKSVPAGTYAMEVLKKLTLVERLSDRLVYGANVRQVLDYVKNGEVSAGIVYSTDAKQAGDGVKVVAAADASWHSPIVYPAVVLKGSKNRAGVVRLVEFLKSDAARVAFRSRGFLDAAPADKK